MAIEVSRVTQQPDGLSRRGSADRAPVTNGVADTYRNQVVLNITSQYANFVYIVQVTSVSFYRTSLGKQRVEKPRWRRGRKQHKQKSRKTLISSEKPSTREIVPASAVFAWARMLSAACFFSRSERSSRKSNSFARSHHNGWSNALLRSFLWDKRSQWRHCGSSVGNASF